MKLIITMSLLLMSYMCWSQKIQRRSGYMSLHLITGFSGENNSIGAGMNFGIRPSKKLGFGLGIDLVDFKNVKTFYVPAYADIKFFFPKIKIFEPFLFAQPGYGLFSYKDYYTIDEPGEPLIESSLSQKGGFYFHSGAGIRGISKMALMLTLGYAHHGFNTVVTGDYFKDRTINNIGSFVIKAGISF